MTSPPRWLGALYEKPDLPAQRLGGNVHHAAVDPGGDAPEARAHHLLDELAVLQGIPVGQAEPASFPVVCIGACPGRIMSACPQSLCASALCTVICGNGTLMPFLQNIM